MNRPQNTAYAWGSEYLNLYLFIRNIESPHYYASLKQQGKLEEFISPDEGLFERNM